MILVEITTYETDAACIAVDGKILTEMMGDFYSPDKGNEVPAGMTVLDPFADVSYNYETKEYSVLVGDEFYSLSKVMAASDAKAIDLVSGENHDAYNKGILVKPLLEEGWYKLEPDGTVTPTDEPA